MSAPGGKAAGSPIFGLVRLALELVLFGLAAWMLYVSGFVRVSLIFVAIVVIHYLLSYDRIS